MRLVKDTAANRQDIDRLPGRTRSSFPSIRDEVFWEFYGKAAPFSLVHIPGFYNIFQSMNYIHQNKIPGDIVECGCYFGGIGIFMALMRDHLKMRKTIYLFDSFEGFPNGEEDIMRGRVAKAHKFANILEDVRDNFRQTVPEVRDIEFVEGFVENTLPAYAEHDWCLLRLDTDFYNSTKIELELLYPQLVRGGVLVVDDYGFFEGARRATDEYFVTAAYPPLLNRIDEGVWAGVKP